MSAAAVLASLSLLVAFEAWLLISPGALFVSGMEADALHLLDALWRIELGQQPHRDFSTPLGILTFESLAIPMRMGLTAGHAMMAANIGVAVLVIPLAFWLHLTRLGLAASIGIGAVGIVIASAMNFAGSDAGATIAMFYNRWGWALLILVLPVLIIPPHTHLRSDAGDGIALGLIGAILMFLKITYGVAALGLFLVWLVATRRWRASVWALGAGLTCAVLVILAFGGPDLVKGYISDLIAMTESGLRTRPGGSIGTILARTDTTLIVFSLVLSALLLLRMGARGVALIWLAMIVALVYVAYQNFGNYLAGAIAAPFMLLWFARRADPDQRAFGAPLPSAMRVFAVGLFFLQAPSLLSLQGSLLAAQSIGPGRSVTMLAGAGVPDIHFTDEGGRLIGAFPIGPDAYNDAQAATFEGEKFPGCTFGTGYEASIALLAGMLRSRPGIAGETVLMADAVNPVWKLAGARPQRGAPIWYYRPLGPAMDEVDLLAVPVCAAAPWVRNMILEEAASHQWRVSHRSSLWVVFTRIGN